MMTNFKRTFLCLTYEHRISIKYSDFNIYEYLTIMQGLIITTNDAVSMHGLNDFNYFIAFSTSPEQKKSQCVKSS